MSTEKYSSGETPKAGDLVEFESTGERLLVSRVLNNMLWIGPSCFSPTIFNLVSRYD